MQWTGRRVLVVGLGRSGIAAARLAKRLGALVALSDTRDGPKQQAAVDELLDVLDCSELGRHSAELFDWAETIVVSPGVPLAQPLFERARQRGQEIIGEVELAYRHLRAPIIGITGTKGKSTTTVLTGEILRVAGQRVFIGGNLGTPLAEALLRDEPLDAAVVELSSFQLETIDRLRAPVAALLNFAADHQDRYARFDDYVNAKLRLFANQLPSDAAVLNGGDPLVMREIGQLAGRVFTFGHPGSNAWCAGKELILSGEGFEATFDITRFHPPGSHNLLNLAASALLAKLAGATNEALAETIVTFRGLAHRIEPLGEIDGVLYVNDSKATTPGSVITSLKAIDRPIHLILGGRDKGGDWTEIEAELLARTKSVLAYGEAADVIAAGLPALGVKKIGPMVEALMLARSLAQPGEAVVLSPGCASFDQFANFEERGEVMRKWVQAQ